MAHIFLYGPSDLPVQFETTGKPSAFLQDLACLVDWEQYNLQGIQCADPQLLEGAACPDVSYTLSCEEDRAVQQTLCLFLFIEHRDTFHSQLPDLIGNHNLVVEHLDQVLRSSAEIVRTALHSLLHSALGELQKRHKDKNKMRSALRVIRDSVSSIVASSTNQDFRAACFSSMQVHDTPELVASVHRSLLEAAENRCLPSKTCVNRKSLTAPAIVPPEPSQGKLSETEDDILEDMCAAFSDHSEEEASAADPVSPGTVKRRWEPAAEDEQPAQCKERRTALYPLHHSPGRQCLCPAEPGISVSRATRAQASQYEGKENQIQPSQEEMLWLQEVSNLSEWN
ncbi:type 2 DNA topoisomerase 6 subunit B-like [Acipenser ruthenus]|uniref:type 2 DNA topoisomerase 6 subunit B-like n=1 Tax=Acipenser ruthenus TaxID=7906 RepID=UPI00274107BE|nr:type 2 DNA topoisomerase 6 subunit B-like [Acipenser ruthenus]